MGSGVSLPSVNAAEKDQSEYENSSIHGANSLPRQRSTSGLIIILEQEFLFKKFRKFVNETWVPANYLETSSYYKFQAKTIALNCIDFYTDVRDFSRIPPSGFQSFRACHIYEKYIMHGAVRQVPMSPIVVDECSDLLLGGKVYISIHVSLYI